MVTPAARREAAAHLCQSYEVSQRRACNAIEADRSAVRYRSLRPDDGAVRARLRELAGLRRRFGYRRLHILLQREGIALNHKKLRRLYRDERLQGVVAASGLWAPGRRWPCRWVRTSAGRSTPDRWQRSRSCA